VWNNDFLPTTRTPPASTVHISLDPSSRSTYGPATVLGLYPSRPRCSCSEKSGHAFVETSPNHERVRKYWQQIRRTGLGSGGYDHKELSRRAVICGNGRYFANPQSKQSQQTLIVRYRPYMARYGYRYGTVLSMSNLHGGVWSVCPRIRGCGCFLTSVVATRLTGASLLVAV